MRQLTVVLTALTVATIQTHAGILDWLRGSQAKGSSADPVASFERGIARLKEHRTKIFNESAEISYDVKKTDSLIEPVVGVVRVVEEGFVYDLRLALRDGSWGISSFSGRMTIIDDLPWAVKPDTPVWTATQACFVSDEAAAAAVAAMSSPPPQTDQRAKPAGETAAAMASTPPSAPANSEVEQPQPAANRVLDNAIRAVENRDYSKAASCFDELSRLATDSDLKSNALSVSDALRRLAETNSETDAQEVLATIKAFRSSVEVVTSTQPVSVGGDVLPAGTSFQFVSQQGSDVRVRYRGGEYVLPISATNLNNR